MLFHIVEDCFVIVRNKGVFRQAKVYARGEALFAGIGAGFVRLTGGGYTTVPTMTWDFITPHPDVSADLGLPAFKPARGPVRLVSNVAAE